MGHNEAPVHTFNVVVLDMSEVNDKTQAIKLSGKLFISGGGLWYKGFDDTYTELAVK